MPEATSGHGFILWGLMWLGLAYGLAYLLFGWG